MRRYLFAVLAALLIVGCGGHSPRPAHRAPGHAQAGHVCSPADQSMQCVLATQPPPAVGLRGLTPFSLQGIDFAWTKFGPSASGFGASYISACDSSKGWSRALVNEWHAAGKGTVGVFECSGTRALAGCAAGAADARSGEAYLASLGFPRSHEDLAIDFDASGPQVIWYFRCANQAEPGLVGAYGGYRPLKYLCDQHVITLSWQTFAWSGGLWLPASCAPLRQVLNGSTFDHDVAVAPNYGQFPTPGPVGPSASTVHRWRGARDASFRAYHHRGCKVALDGACGVLGQRVVYFQHKLWTVAPRWACFGKHARTRAAICWVVRPTNSWRVHARGATQRAEVRVGCIQVSVQQPANPRLCRLLARRFEHFAELVKATLKEYG